MTVETREDTAIQMIWGRKLQEDPIRALGLINRQVSEALVTMAYASGHGVANGELGASLVYYALVFLARAEVCVCLGSGGGFVPALMRLAQRDLRLEMSTTYLVDAILPEAGYGGPEGPDGWMAPNSVLRTCFNDIVVLNSLTVDAGKKFFRKNRIRIDYLHIDADHSFAGAFGDFEVFEPLLGRLAFVTFHDSKMASVQQAIQAVRDRYPEFQCLDIPDVGAGIAIMRRRMSP